jgi:hypothetical protein
MAASGANRVDEGARKLPMGCRRDRRGWSAVGSKRHFNFEKSSRCRFAAGVASGNNRLNFLLRPRDYPGAPAAGEHRLGRLAFMCLSQEPILALPSAACWWSPDVIGPSCRGRADAPSDGLPSKLCAARYARRARLDGGGRFHFQRRPSASVRDRACGPLVYFR